MWGGAGTGHWVRCTVNRSRVVEDSYYELNALGPDLKKTIQARVSFVNSEGLQEAGIDGGGLFKEFVNTLSREAFNPNHGLFCQTPEGLLFPNPKAEAAQTWQDMEHIKLFEFLGRIVGKLFEFFGRIVGKAIYDGILAIYDGIRAIYDGILVELRFASFFLRKMLGKERVLASFFPRKMLGKEMFFDDLGSLDPDLHKNLLYVKNYEGDFDDLALNFVAVEDHFGAAREYELLPGGKNVPVTADNVLKYKNLVADWWLNRRIQQQSKAFMRGLQQSKACMRNLQVSKDLVQPEWIRMFSPDELQMMISGSTLPVDIDDLRGNCVYGGGYSEEHATVKIFWEVLNDFDQKERKALEGALFVDYSIPMVPDPCIIHS
ncbi:hypothetical protein T484DRAFT_1770889 [Baffinella frigidus]|nr:hypothetical protein T484DRAFT_1770889 [Cryptophyta sp. CCMP2293]